MTAAATTTTTTPLTGTDTPYRFVRRRWDGQDIGGWSVVRADNGRHLGWVCQPALGDHPKWVRWQARVAEEAFIGDGPDDTGHVMDKVPEWLLGAGGRGAVIGEGRNRDEAVFELLMWLDGKWAPAVGHGRHGEVRRWADR